jgi:hypothetical protein
MLDRSNYLTAAGIGNLGPKNGSVRCKTLVPFKEGSSPGIPALLLFSANFDVAQSPLLNEDT